MSEGGRSVSHAVQDLWIIINGTVYDVTEFLPDHPGGKKTLLKYAGLDGSKGWFADGDFLPSLIILAEFNALHNPNVLKKWVGDKVMGTVAPQPKL